MFHKFAACIRFYRIPSLYVGIQVADEYDRLIGEVSLCFLYFSRKCGIVFFPFRDWVATNRCICLHNDVVLRLYHSNPVVYFFCCLDFNFLSSNIVLDIYSRSSCIACQIVVVGIISSDVWRDAVLFMCREMCFS